MKTLLRLIALHALCLGALRAAMDPIAAVTVADNERVAAVTAADRAGLEAILSSELRYAHSNGKIDTKESLVAALTSHRTTYENFEYKERTFRPVAPGVVLMAGRVVIHVRSEGQALELDLNYLAVWREENGKWRFLAWQSSHNPAASPGSTGK